MAKKSDSIVFKVSLDNLDILLKKIKDLTKLDNRVLFRLDSTSLLLYSYVGKGVNVHGFKSHILKTRDIFFTKEDFNEELKFVISDAKRFITSMVVFVNYMRKQNILDDVDLKLTYNEDLFCEVLQIKNKKSKEELGCGDISAFGNSINVNQINDIMDINKSKYHFVLNREDFDYIKAKTSIEKENDVLYLNNKNGDISLSESKWEHNIIKIENNLETDSTVCFPKKYFKCINYDGEDTMTIYIFEEYIMVMSENSNLLISIELTG